MKIELKNIKINEAFSEETLMFQADVFVNGVKCAYAKNDGRGGCTFYHQYEGKMDLLREAENYCKSLPRVKYSFGEFDMNLETLIDDLLEKHYSKKSEEKFKKKVEKLSETAIVFGVPGNSRYSIISFKGSPKFEDLKKTAQGKLSLESLVNKVRSQLKDGEVIFNKNI